MSAGRTLADRARAAYAQVQQEAYQQEADTLLDLLADTDLLVAPGAFRDHPSRVKPALYLWRDSVIAVVDGVLFTADKHGLKVLLTDPDASNPELMPYPTRSLLGLGELLSSSLVPAILPLGAARLPNQAVPLASDPEVPQP